MNSDFSTTWNGELFDQLWRLQSGAVHSVCALEMLDRVLKDLQPVGAPEASSHSQDAGAHWQALAEQRALEALREQSDLIGLKDRWSANDIESMAANLEAMHTSAAGVLAKRLRGDSTERITFEERNGKIERLNFEDYH